MKVLKCVVVWQLDKWLFKVLLSNVTLFLERVKTTKFLGDSKSQNDINSNEERIIIKDYTNYQGKVTIVHKQISGAVAL